MKFWIRQGLLLFAVFTLGYGLGKEAGFQRASASAGSPRPPAGTEESDKVLVYYFHTTFRCATCNRIEELARNVVKEDFTEELASGAVEWRTVNFQERAELAGRYNVTSSTVVVVDIDGGNETSFERLDDVWTLYDQPGAFSDYVRDTIRTCLRET